MTKSELLQIAKPILFNTDMVQAILDGKTVTRRKIPGRIVLNPEAEHKVCFFPSRIRKDRGREIKSIQYFTLESFTENEARYKKGDILYVRETFRPLSSHPGSWFEYAADWSQKYFENSRDPKACNGGKWIPSIHMPKEAARIFLDVLDVKVQHLHDMTLDDFLEEGVVLRPEAFNDPENAYWQAQSIFAEEIWNKTLKSKVDQELYNWDANPWVWAIRFKRVYPDDMEV